MSTGTPDRDIDWNAMHARIRAAMDGLERGFEPDQAEVDRRLRERAERLARATQAPAVPRDEIRILEFDIGGRRHAVDSRLVREVTPSPPPTRVPQAPAWAAGVVHLRGEIVTVLDFSALTGCAGAEPDDGPLVVLHQGGRVLALASSAVQGLHPVARSSLDPVPATVHGHRRFYLGVTEQGALVLDAGAFFEDGALTGIVAADGSAGTRGN
ncbi:chemotaxis protein CheW [Niveispirillum sp.]|uniref:chemotaxis protein CheW n=1 Tax=Niveispirillum sp. TaxID=1917217 RepID=UPI001B744669|nr:chemotaxis protein CheW [Niveispirillum sp.]MBP7334462.1 chemotaxis protein CheW [Niveispirillum sp.]